MPLERYSGNVHYSSWFFIVLDSSLKCVLVLYDFYIVLYSVYVVAVIRFFLLFHTCQIRYSGIVTALHIYTMIDSTLVSLLQQDLPLVLLILLLAILIAPQVMSLRRRLRLWQRRLSWVILGFGLGLAVTSQYLQSLF
jgi:hypothetical protein